jgi:FkbM family methyltransferase
MTAEPQLRLDHLDEEMVRRVQMTISCRDTDAIPKVEGAGEVFVKDGRPLQRMHNGVLIAEGCYYGPWMTEVIRSLRGHHEPQEESVFHAILQRVVATEDEPSMIELGSWWAYYSLWFAAEARRGRVVALEPDPTYLEIGRRNFALNDLEARFVHGAIGEGARAVAPFILERTGERARVPYHDLESLLELAGLERVSLLLADIQGAETSLLDRGRRALDAGRVRFLVLSTHHHSISGSPLTHQDARELLAALGAHVVAEHTVGESFSGDGLIAAAFDQRDRDLQVEVSRARYSESLFGELEPDLAEAWRRERRATRELEEARRELASVPREPLRSAVRRAIRARGRRAG